MPRHIILTHINFCLIVGGGGVAWCGHLRSPLPYFEDFSAAQPFLLQQVNNQLVYNFLSQQNFVSELMDLFVAG